MHLIAASLIALALNQSVPVSPGVHELTFPTAGGGSMLYAISIPRNYDPRTPAPLVLVLHSGGERMRYYGSAFMRLLVEPALSDLRAIMVAPDCPTNSWTDAASEDAVMALLQSVLDQFTIDRRRVLVTDSVSADAAPGSWPHDTRTSSPPRFPWRRHRAICRSIVWRQCRPTSFTAVMMR